MHDELERVLDPDYLGDLPARPIEEIRSMRVECQRHESALSYARRVAQGRLDLLRAEQERRAAGGDPADLDALVDQLPAILAGQLRAPGNGRLTERLGPDDPSSPLLDELASMAGEADLNALPDTTDADLVTLLSKVQEFETQVSELRHRLFERIDNLQAELTRRYRTGEASVETLLS